MKDSMVKKQSFFSRIGEAFLKKTRDKKSAREPERHRDIIDNAKNTKPGEPSEPQRLSEGDGLA